MMRTGRHSNLLLKIMIPRKASYLVQYACFSCCKSFKRSAKGDCVVCPHCGGEAKEMGRNFRAPKRNDVEQWEKVRILFDGGVRFWGEQSGNFGPFPETPAEAIEFVSRNRRELDRQEKNYRRSLEEKSQRERRRHEKGRTLR